MGGEATYRLTTDEASSTLRVAGAMTFDTAARLYPEAEQILRAQTIDALDLQAVDRVDSAGLACVLALKAVQHGRDRTLAIAGAPHGLRSLAQVSDTLAWLPGTAQTG